MTADPQLICVVDDEPSVRRALGRHLRSLGYSSRQFGSGQELLANGRCDDVGCFVIDISMPEMNGYEVARRLKETAPDTPVILITAREEERERWRAQGTSAIGLLLKPFSNRELTAALKLALG